jgi:chromosome segregation ATPase
MDLTQAMQTLRWLDEERLKDKATIAALQERVQGQEQQLAQQVAQMQDLRAAVGGIQGIMSKVAEFEQTVSNYRNEIILQMDQREETRRKEQAEAARLRQIEYEALTTNLSRLEKDMRVLPRYDETLSGLRAEDQRLSEAMQRTEAAVTDLSQRSDDRVQAVTYLEEQRRADNRRISDLESDTTELHRRIESLITKFPLLEERVQKQGPRIEEAIQEAKRLEKPIEELRVSDFQREQKMKQYLDQGEQVAKELERVRTQTHGFIEQQQQVKRALDKLQSFQARMEKRQNEVSEMQRVAENRFKRQWEEWQDGQEKQQKKRDVITEEHRRKQEQVNTGHEKHLGALQAATDLHRSQLDALWEAHRASVMRALEVSRGEYETIASLIDEQLSSLRGE